MKIRNYSNQAFGAKVKIDYRQLREIGGSAIRGADGIKPILKRRPDNIVFSISRAHRLNPDIKDSTFMSDMLVPSPTKAIVTVKKLNKGFGEKFRNLFRLNFSQSVSTHDCSTIGLRVAANKAEKMANTERGENIFSFILKVLSGPKDSMGPC